MAKKLTFSKIQKMEVGSKKYIKSVKNLFNIKIDADIMKDISKRRKEMYRDIKKGMNAFDVMLRVKADTDYLNAIHEREYSIVTGAYLEKRASSYISNYIDALKAMTIDRNLINLLDENPNIILEGLLPEIDNYYVFLKGKGKSKKGKNYEVNIGMADTYEQDIKEKIKEYYGEDILKQYGVK